MDGRTDIRSANGQTKFFSTEYSPVYAGVVAVVVLNIVLI